MDHHWILDIYILGGNLLIGILVWLLRRNILRRITQITKQVNRLSASSGQIVENNVKGQDTLSNLEGIINKTIAELRKSQQDLTKSEEKYRRLVEQCTIITYTDAINDSSSALFFSPQVEKLLGYSVEEWIADPELWINIIHPEDTDRVIEEHLRTNRTGEPFSMEYRMIARNSRVVWVYDEAVLYYDEQGQPLHWVGVMQDITIRKQAEEAENRERELVHALYESGKILNSSLDFDLVLDHLLEAIARVVPYDCACVLLVEHGNAQVVRARGYGRFGFSADIVALQKFEIKKNRVLSQLANTRRSMIIADMRTEPDWAASQINQNALSWIGAPLINRGKTNGFLSLGSLQGGFYLPEHAQNLDIFATQAAIAIQNARLFKQVQDLAIVDQLTGIFNRRHFFDKATTAFERAKRFNRPVCLLMWDIDHFKDVNDTYGHIAGDRVLQCVAERSRQNLREFDLIGRYGGEEFVAFLEEADHQKALEVAERLRVAIAQSPYHVDGNSISISISVGVAEVADCKHLEEMLDRADRALYRAKRNGRNRVWTWGKTGQLVSKSNVAT